MKCETEKGEIKPNKMKMKKKEILSENVKCLLTKTYFIYRMARTTYELFSSLLTYTIRPGMFLDVLFPHICTISRHGGY